MVVTISWIKKNYNKFNNLYWNGTLPDIEFKINNSKNSWGFASFRYDFPNDTIIPECITLSNYYDSPEKVKIQTLLHEMIHIADYFWHPEHFIHNGRRVPRRYYNAHGYWFNSEAKRISKESGYDIANHVTKEEIESSSLSTHSKKIINHKKDVALICAVTGTNGVIFYFKTDIYKAKNLKEYLKKFTWYKIDNIKSIKFYTFDDPNLAALRSCETRIRGWHTDKIGFHNTMTRIKGTEIHI